MRRPSWLHSPASLQGRITLAIVLVALASIIGQALIQQIVDRSVRDDLERDLRAQAQLIANDVAVAPPSQRLDRAATAGRYLSRTRIVVTWPQKPGIFVNVIPFDREVAEVAAQSGDVEVKLARQADSAALSRSALLGVLAVGVIAAIGVWILAGSLTRRLVRQARQLAGAAESIASGEMSARVPETDDELGRVGVAFNRMADQLEESDQRQRRLIADVAHELRTPVTAIQGFADALTDGTATDEADRLEAAEFIRDEAERLATLVADLRQITLIDVGADVTIERVDLRSVADRACARMAPVADADGIALASEGPSTIVMSDPGHLDTIVANLVINAIHASSRGDTVTVRVGSADRSPTLAVIDSGVGIDPADHERIFDRLYRVDPTRARSEGGSGLGLAIVRRLALLLSIDVTVDSAVGQGATFTVAFREEHMPPQQGEHNG